MPIGERLGDAARKRAVLNRETIYINSFVVESRLGRRDPFEYEDRCTETEYDLPDEQD